MDTTNQLELLNKNNQISQYNLTNIDRGFQSALQIVDDIILKKYIMNLSSLSIVPVNSNNLKNNIKNNVLLFEITEMVYEKEEFALYKFATVYNSLLSSNSSIFLVVNSDGMRTKFYMGVRSVDPDRTTSSIRNTIENSLKGQFPGTKTKHCTIEETQDIISSFHAQIISSVSGVGQNRVSSIDKNQSFIQGLEKFVLSMQGEKYTGIIIADATNQMKLHELRRSYEKIYTQLSSLSDVQINYTENISFSHSLSDTKGKTEGKSYSKNQSDTKGNTYTTNITITKGTSQENKAGKIAKGVASASNVLGAVLAGSTGGLSLVAASGVSMIAPLVSKTVTESKSDSHSSANNSSHQEGYSVSDNTSENTSTTQTDGRSDGNSKSITMTLQDKSIQDILERIDKQLKRIDEFESLGMFESAAYFLSDSQYAAEVAASTYKGLMRGENSGVEVSTINTWTKNDIDFYEIIKYVTNFIHPVFRYASFQAEQIEVTPCSLVSGNELAIQMGLPRHSVCGFPVIEHAEFGHEVIKYNDKLSHKCINIGKIFNMGSLKDNHVTLDIESLAMHTFITGSTGSGKSNTVYELLKQLMMNGIHFLVIEPAKGEYKHAFGNYKDVQVYGTNPTLMELLRINPFSFPEGIHVLEHIDRLVEIFNVCWPMYAAMPAVLKNAIELSYEDCGWDLTTSTNRYDEYLYPCFNDISRNIKIIIDTSEYDNENKGAYKGSLLTRLKSLTNGIYGMMFTSKELSGEELFDNNVIVDLSRVGSMETKSLLMGMLMLKLQEYRMTSFHTTNESLHHVTVLEEAHNLLKRTSTEQSSESSNLLGKSVEMISSAIAEMRTYGEGFIIADQAPGLLDMAAIRNTNTKIIMRLPDQQDRELVGKAANLNDDQITELAKLPLGVAAIYQNDWVEPVLCQINRAKVSDKLYNYKPSSTKNHSHNDDYSIISLLLNKDQINKMNYRDIKDNVLSLDVDDFIKASILKILQCPTRKLKVTTLSPIVSTLFPEVKNAIIESIHETNNPVEWTKSAEVALKQCIHSEMNRKLKSQIIQSIMTDYLSLELHDNVKLELWNKKGGIR